MKTYKLFDYQEEAVQQITDFFIHGGRSTILQLPTGAGKSLTAVHRSRTPEIQQCHHHAY